jgi:hypothetical protein
MGFFFFLLDFIKQIMILCVGLNVLQNIFSEVDNTICLTFDLACTLPTSTYEREDTRYCRKIIMG